MSRRLPPLNALRAFEAAARLGSFISAAAELGVTANAISRHVILLEARLGRLLFHRGPRSLTLTADGRALRPVLSEALDGMETGIARALFRKPRAALEVFAQTSFALGWMLSRLPHFHREQPEIELCLSTGIETPNLRGQSPGVPDAAVLHGRGPWPDLATHLLFPDCLIPVCAPAWLAARDISEARALAAETLLVSNTAPEDWAEWLAHAGARGGQPERTLRFGSSLLPPQAAMHGLGVALADLFLVQSELASGRLVNPLPAVPPLRRGTGWHLAHLPSRAEERPITVLRDWLLREAGG
ncbi:LysR substrate-binding domain-containing protein [Enterovirga sp.]|uniref:LysR substrate-binding domain-containing protein n=1 Tax=Enterovirga sp. TaxID=2026350 RepID=UPI002C918FEA|nr:LysR substrate-binding domain-containing protein [Enterovirga sp.]HMO28574.1 LysR substrate-binding domain-containing protein [Enterovirga sp.]